MKNCMLDAFEQITGIWNLETLLGPQDSYPNNPEPFNKSGYHIQEFIRVLWPNFICMHIESSPVAQVLDTYRYIDNSQFLMKLISESNGVLYGVSSRGIPHAVPNFNGLHEHLPTLGGYIMILKNRNQIINS